MARYLNPGDYVFGHFPEGVRTLLGSCVSLVFWHSGQKLLAASHILLPEYIDSGDPQRSRAGRFADRVFERLALDIAAAGTSPTQYWKGLYGGSRVLGTGATGVVSVGERNLAYVRARATTLGWHFNHVSVGGQAARRIAIDGLTGRVEVESIPTPVPEA